MSIMVLDDRYIKAIQAIYRTKLFTLTEIGKMFHVSRTTIQRYLNVRY